MCRGFESVCSSDQCREYFKECGLTYKDITEQEILILVMLLRKELKDANKAGETSVSTMRLSEKIDMKKRSNGSIETCFLYLNSHYFTRRECISFNQDGFIGFCGWADTGNSNPVKRAFLKWCDAIKEVDDERA